MYTTHVVQDVSALLCEPLLKNKGAGGRGFQIALLAHQMRAFSTMGVHQVCYERTAVRKIVASCNICKQQCVSGPNSCLCDRQHIIVQTNWQLQQLTCTEICHYSYSVTSIVAFPHRQVVRVRFLACQFRTECEGNVRC